jgi:hypothetical protein
MTTAARDFGIPSPLKSSTELAELEAAIIQQLQKFVRSWRSRGELFHSAHV